MKLPSPLVRILVGVAFGCLMTHGVWGQTNSAYQPGTIMEVKPHHAASAPNSAAKQYDVSVKVGDTIYVVLFTPPPGSTLVEYRAGTELLVSVEGDTMKFNDLTGKSETVPILSRKETAKKN